MENLVVVIFISVVLLLLLSFISLLGADVFVFVIKMTVSFNHSTNLLLSSGTRRVLHAISSASIIRTVFLPNKLSGLNKFLNLNTFQLLLSSYIDKNVQYHHKPIPEIYNLKTGIQFPTKENKHLILDLRLFNTPLHLLFCLCCPSGFFNEVSSDVEWDGLTDR